MPKKDNSGGRKTRDVASIDEWTSHIKRHVEIVRDDDSIDRFLIHSLDTEQVNEIQEYYHKNLPPEPKKLRDKNGKEIDDPHYIDRLKDYEKKRRDLNEECQFRYILKGWVEPNEIEIPGNTIEEKIAYLKKGKAGDAVFLFNNILRLSNIGTEDIDFF